MPQCVCPNCKMMFSAYSSEFGEIHHCVFCGHEFKLDVTELAHYHLPERIQIQLVDIDGNSFTLFPVPVIVSYGYQFPPLCSDKNGMIQITKEMFVKAQKDETSTGIMDYKGDYSLNRFIHIKILDRNESIAASKARLNSKWQILDFEKELYGNINSLALAYIPEADIVPVETRIDLAEENNIVSLEIKVSVTHPSGK